MRFFFHPLADAEFNEAIRYYEESEPGLGLELAEEVYSTIQRISEFPEAWASMSQNTRRCLVNRFPVGVIFQVKGGILHIIAVANLHRRPGYWKNRV